MTTPNSKTNVLFLCTGNSARSLMAEAIVNHQFSDALHASSAGSKPKGEPHPLTIETLKKNQLKSEGLRSKSWNEVTSDRFDLVITLCDAAKEEKCPVFPGNPATIHWGLPDPANGTAEDFDSVFEMLTESIGYLVHGPEPTAKARAAEAGRELTRRFAPRAI